MSGIKNRELIDFPYGFLFVGPEDPLCIKREKKVKSINIKAALEYARKARIEGRDLTMDEMQQFVELED